MCAGSNGEWTKAGTRTPPSQAENLPPRSGQFEPPPIWPGIAPLSDAKTTKAFS